MDINATNKRSFDSDQVEGDITSAIQTKRAALTSESGEKYHDASDSSLLFKVLCPPAVVGQLIGKGGANVSQLNQQTGAKIRISQNNELYPETGDRIVCILGNKTAVDAAITGIISSVIDESAADPMTGDAMASFEFRCLIPIAAAGTIIGRAGSHIKEMGDLSSCKLKLGENADPYNTKERVLIARGSTADNLAHAIKLVWARLLSDRETGNYIITRMTYPPSSLPGRPGFPNAGSPNGMNPGFIPHAPQMMGGYPSHPSMQASHTGYDAYAGRSNPAQDSRGAYDAMPGSYGAQSRSDTRAAPAARQPLAPVSNLLPQGVSTPTFMTDGVDIIMEMGIEDLLLGNIIGRGGMIIKDIMQLSGSKVNVSQKGEFISGTTFRPIKVVGSQAQVQAALSNIVSRIQAAIDLKGGASGATHQRR